MFLMEGRRNSSRISSKISQVLAESPAISRVEFYFILFLLLIFFVVDSSACLYFIISVD